MEIIEVLNLLCGNSDCSTNLKGSKSSAGIVIAPCSKPAHLSSVALPSQRRHRLTSKCICFVFTEKARIARLVVKTRGILRETHTDRDIWIGWSLACEACPALSVVWALNRIACVSSSHLASPRREAWGMIKTRCRRICLSKVNAIDGAVLIWITAFNINFLNPSTGHNNLWSTKVCWSILI